MSLSPAIVDAMVSSGCSVEQLAAVMKAALAEGDQHVSDRRAKDAERQRRHRASRDVTVTNGDSVTAPALSPSPNENNSNPHPHTHPDVTTRAREAFPKPDWADPQHWRDLKANRKAKRLPCTATAHAKLLRDIDKLTDDAWPPGRLLEAIVARGWAAAYDPREDRVPRHASSARPPISNRNAADLARQKLAGYG